MDTKNRFGLMLVSKIMNWSKDEKSLEEFKWLEFIAKTKYDHYSGYQAGSGFIEHFAIWLKQFKPEDRKTAYNFVKSNLVYISSAELYRIVEAFVPEIVLPNIRKKISKIEQVPMYQIYLADKYSDTIKLELRKCLFIGLSDGSRIDILRRFNSKLLSTEQILPMMNIDNEKWNDLNENLKDDIKKIKDCISRKSKDYFKVGEAKFNTIYLIDDFTASGTTFIRYVDKKWKGKLNKFLTLIHNARKNEESDSINKVNFPIAKSFDLNIHHYLCTENAKSAIDKCKDEYEKENSEFLKELGVNSINVTAGHEFSSNLKITDSIEDLCKLYYNPSLYERLEKHCKEAKQTSMELGFANCALPLVLEHNTPNNSIPLLWADTTDEDEGHQMHPLFLRRDRHG